MKISILYITSILLLSLTMLLGCQSRAKKVENAEDKVQDAKKDLADSKKDLYQIRLDTISNYVQFKIEAEKLIIVQEKNIADFKASLKSEKKEMNADYDKKLLALENKNNELKKKLADYKDEGQDKWNGFKNEFNHDMNELGKAFKDLTVENIE
ncbi:MAG: hypothetical protein PF485_04870 [Bacteroidales bacterium]|jgi:hypothetical protein|nr:hypothetical protein [Bacteroidales bacterium]